MGVINAMQNYTRLVIPAFSDLDMIPVKTFFQTLFTSGETIVEQDALAIDIDIQRGNKKIAAYIARGTDAINLSEKRGLIEKFTSDTKVFGLIEEITPITSTMVKKRMPGEPVRGFPVQEKQAALAMKAHKNDLRRIIGRLELSAAEAFRLAQQTIKEGVYDFYRRSTHNINATTAWSTSATAVPNTDLENACTLISRDGNRMPTDTIMSDESWREYLATTQIEDLADSRRIIHFVADMNQSAPAGYESWITAGAAFMGQVKVGQYKLNIWTYDGIYETDAGTQTQYLPDGEVLVMAKGARMDRYFGPKDNLEMNSDIYKELFGLSDFEGVPANVVNSGIFSSNMFHTDVYTEGNGKAFNVRTQCAPIYPTIETDTIVKIAT